MAAENGSKLVFCFFFTASIVFIDQITKQYAEKNLIYGEAVEIFPGIRMALLHNPGAAFGILSNQSGWQVGFLVGVSLLAAIGLVVWSFQSIKTRRIIPENLNLTWAKLTLISIIIYWLIRIILQYGYNLNVFPEY